jgi:hypothetical protein
MSASLHELIDATGGGCCRLRADSTIDSASPGFVALVGARNELTGLHPHAVLAELPALSQLPASISSDAPIFRQVGSDGLGRELAAALVRDRSSESGSILLLVDRSGEARLRRSQARLGRQIEDLKAELAARDQEPHRPRIRSMSELIRRLDESLARAHRYGHAVTIVAVQIEAEQDAPADREKLVGDRLLGCVRGVDDLGRVDANDWVVALPHTPLAGGEVVAKRIHERLGELGLKKVGVGVAQVGLDEPGAVAVERAEQAAGQAMESGGGLLLGVALT